MGNNTLVCPPADIGFDEQGNVLSHHFGDVYFSRQDGLSEARMVFLDACGLPSRWQGRRQFTVAELGFGTGLNFLALLDQWERHRPPKAWLHFVSVEGRPLTRNQAEASLGRFPELKRLAQEMLQQWPPRWKGVHRRRFDPLKVTLTLLQDEAIDALREADFQADAWFLDGFSPRKNPDMWLPGVFCEIARLSAAGARLGTYSVSGEVRRGLEQVGFAVVKKRGFGRKRERLEAEFQGSAALPDASDFPRATPRDGKVAILGGGIAAASMAEALKTRGRERVMIAGGGLLSGASATPYGLLTPRLEAADRPHVRATLAAFSYARQLYADKPGFYPSGVVKLEGPEVSARTRGSTTGRMFRAAALLRQVEDEENADYHHLSSQEAFSRSGLCPQTNPSHEGIWFESGGYFEPGPLVQALAQDTEVINKNVTQIEPIPQGWRLAGDDFALEAENLVLAGGFGMAQLLLKLDLEVASNLGQVTLHDPWTRPQVPITWGGYVIPGPKALVMGATHEHGTQPSLPAESVLRERLFQVAPELAQQISKSSGVWTGIRAVSQDRLPFAGFVRPGLAVLGGFGSRGFAHAPLLAELVAGDWTGAPACLSRSALEALHPARFAVRKSRRKGVPSDTQ